MPLPQPSAAASATSCQVSKWSIAGASLASRNPGRPALGEKGRHALLRFRRGTDASDAPGRIGDHRIVDGPVGDGANEKLRLRLSLRSGGDEEAEQLIDLGVELGRDGEIVQQA